jgi:hypothetical protein
LRAWVSALSRPFISSRAWGLKRSVGDPLKVTVWDFNMGMTFALGLL